MQVTYHFPQFLTLKNAHFSHNQSESLNYDYSDFEEGKFLDDFNQINFPTLLA